MYRGCGINFSLILYPYYRLYLYLSLFHELLNLLGPGIVLNVCPYYLQLLDGFNLFDDVD